MLFKIYVNILFEIKALEYKHDLKQKIINSSYIEDFIKLPIYRPQAFLNDFHFDLISQIFQVFLNEYIPYITQ